MRAAAGGNVLQDEYGDAEISRQLEALKGEVEALRNQREWGKPVARNGTPLASNGANDVACEGTHPVARNCTVYLPGFPVAWNGVNPVACDGAVPVASICAPFPSGGHVDWNGAPLASNGANQVACERTRPVARKCARRGYGDDRENGYAEPTSHGRESVTADRPTPHKGGNKQKSAGKNTGCWLCGAESHLVRDCPKLRRGQQSNNGSESQNAPRESRANVLTSSCDVPEVYNADSAERPEAVELVGYGL